jgi:hypothetical protein
MEDVNSNNASAGLMGKLKDGAVSQLNTQKNRATDGIGSVAQAVRQGTQQLRDQQHDVIARYVEDAASRIDRFANSLRERDVNDLLSDAQRFARRNPALFIGSAFAVGLVSARFLKSSRPNGNGGSSSGWRERTGANASTASRAGYGAGWDRGAYTPSPVGTSGSPQAGRGGTGTSSGTAGGATGTSRSFGTGDRRDADVERR